MLPIDDAIKPLFPENVVHLSNLCTEILEVTSDDETAVCNLGSINLGRHMDINGVDYDKIGRTVQRAVRQLNRVIDLNYYPIEATRAQTIVGALSVSV